MFKVNEVMTSNACACDGNGCCEIDDAGGWPAIQSSHPPARARLLSAVASAAELPNKH